MTDIVERLRRLYVQNGTNYVQEAADEIERLRAELAAANSAVSQFHHAMKDAGWHPGRTDDSLPDIIRQKGAELAAPKAWHDWGVA